MTSENQFLSSNTQDFIEVGKLPYHHDGRTVAFLSSNTQDFIEVQKLYHDTIRKDPIPEL